MFLRHDLLEVQILRQHASSSSSLPPAPPALERVCSSRRQTESSAGGCDPGERDKERPQRANCSTAVKSHCGRAPWRSLEEHNAVSDKHSVGKYVLVQLKLTTVSSIDNANRLFFFFLFVSLNCNSLAYCAFKGVVCKLTF